MVIGEYGRAVQRGIRQTVNSASNETSSPWPPYLPVMSDFASKADSCHVGPGPTCTGLGSCVRQNGKLEEGRGKRESEGARD